MSTKQLIEALKQVDPDAPVHILTADKSRGNLIVELEPESVHVDADGVNIDCQMGPLNDMHDEDYFDRMTF
ncbi:hypothetical protein QPK87_04000 [Kamptonema cortianum]|nr:hypothetical protein [Oscillatoria laete-virens]MDK3155742.1 hypothetical protein [Kamptonema cortianum]MDL5048041.1 hypothetical protein [Oscillatoria amoena NRMC-F 0135]MDL5052523.1 hypothetical protein [Oscillatoria laete-virens NRMC-F 0139]